MLKVLVVHDTPDRASALKEALDVVLIETDSPSRDYWSSSPRCPRARRGRW